MKMISQQLQYSAVFVIGAFGDQQRRGDGLAVSQGDKGRGLVHADSGRGLGVVSYKYQTLSANCAGWW
jgi:hypothetical protein